MANQSERVACSTLPAWNEAGSSRAETKPTIRSVLVTDLKCNDAFMPIGLHFPVSRASAGGRQSDHGWSCRSTGTHRCTWPPPRLLTGSSIRSRHAKTRLDSMPESLRTLHVLKEKLLPSMTARHMGWCPSSRLQLLWFIVRTETSFYYPLRRAQPL